MKNQQTQLKQFCIDLNKDPTMKRRFDQCIERLKININKNSDDNFHINCNDELAELIRSYRYYINGGFKVSSLEKIIMRDNLSNYIKSLCQTT